MKVNQVIRSNQNVLSVFINPLFKFLILSLLTKTHKLAHNASHPFLALLQQMFSAEPFGCKSRLFYFIHTSEPTDEENSSCVQLLFLVPSEDLKTDSINLFLLAMDYTTPFIVQVVCNNSLCSHLSCPHI